MLVSWPKAGKAGSSLKIVTNAREGFKKASRKNKICSEVHVGGLEGTNGSSRAEENSS